MLSIPAPAFVVIPRGADRRPDDDGEVATMDDATTWELIHQERAGMVETLATLAPAQWAEPSLCNGWTVQVTAAHIVVGAEQTPGRFFRRMAANGMRFNTMMDRDARRIGARPADEIVWDSTAV